MMVSDRMRPTTSARDHPKAISAWRFHSAMRPSALLASPQLGFDLPEVGDVGTGPKPFDDVSFAIPHGSAAGLEPAVHAVRTADAVFHVVGTATGHRVGPEPPGRLTVVRVERRQPAPAQQVALRHPGMLRPLRAEVVTSAVGRGAPDQLR